MKARAIVHSGPFEVRLVEFEQREPRPGEVLVLVRHSCVSPGTELRCLAGRQPDAVPFPYVPGYAMAGDVLRCGSGVGIEPGARVYLNGTVAADGLALMWGGHVSHAVAPAANCIVLPDTVSTMEASLAHLCGIAYHGRSLARPEPGERVAIVGLGILGQICARLYQVTGCCVAACDMSETRVALARRLGVTARTADGGISAALRTDLPDGADVIVDATGSEAALRDALGVARDVPWGDTAVRGVRYVVQGSYPGDVPVPYQPAFLKEAALLFPRDCTPSDRRAVIALMASGDLRPADWLGPARLPADAQEVYEALAKRDAPTLTTVFDWD
jgi:2-desacetyl-2-hydroxyethyl bacteriochlorophyllide A dehydrogenase